MYNSPDCRLHRDLPDTCRERDWRCLHPDFAGGPYVLIVWVIADRDLTFCLCVVLDRQGSDPCRPIASGLPLRDIRIFIQHSNAIKTFISLGSYLGGRD